LESRRLTIKYVAETASKPRNMEKSWRSSDVWAENFASPFELPKIADEWPQEANNAAKTPMRTRPIGSSDSRHWAASISSPRPQK